MSNTERYDYLPVTDVGSDGKERIAGLYAVGACTAGEDVSAERVDRRFCPLSEDLLIGAKVSILDYIDDSGKKPVRLVVSDSGIVGLVTRSDLQKPPARVALFALLTGFEVIMSDVIRTRLPCDGWMQCLSCGRRQILEEQINKSRSLESDDFVDALLFTKFCDKREILLKFNAVQGDFSKETARGDLKKIEDLRDRLAHANEYDPHKVHAVVGKLLTLRRRLKAFSDDGNECE